MDDQHEWHFTPFNHLSTFLPYSLLYFCTMWMFSAKSIKSNAERILYVQKSYPLEFQ